MAKYRLKIIKLIVCLLLCTPTGFAQPTRKGTVRPAAFKISLPPQLGEVSQSYCPIKHPVSLRPDFILIQNVHSNIYVQFVISEILKNLKHQQLLPERIAIEGGKGPIDLGTVQTNTNRNERKQIAQYLVSKGEMTGAAHFIAVEGAGELFGVENNSFYQPSVEMFRHSYYGRSALSKQLDRLEDAIALLKMEPGESNRTSILEQDIQVIRRLIDQQLLPTEIHQVMTRAVFAVEHLKHFVPGQRERALLQPVSAAVNFYAFALLRDKGLLTHSEELRLMDRQKTTVLITGGFHTPGITRLLKEKGYSYIVITPEVKSYNPTDERLYIQRVLGYPIPTGKTKPRDLNVPLLSFAHQTADVSRKKATENGLLASELRSKLSKTPFQIPHVRDIFTALDKPLPSQIKVSLIKQRAEMLAEQMAFNR